VIRIDQRDPEIETRNSYYHWEVDTIISWTRQWRIATMLERKSRYTGMKKTSSGQAVEVSQALIDIGVKVWIEKILTITSDNWKEFSSWKLVAEWLQSLFYFAFPHHSRERWGNENWNRCIRKHFPKWTDFELLSDEDIEKVETMINNKPRQVLDYRTPSEELMGEKLSYFRHHSVWVTI
jgi:transposase, IS30 family